MYLRILLRSGVVAWIKDKVIVRSKRDERLVTIMITDDMVFYKKIASDNTVDFFGEAPGWIPYHAVDNFKVMGKKGKGLPSDDFDIEAELNEEVEKVKSGKKTK